MQLFIYNIFLALYSLATRFVALFNSKARRWIDGRRGIMNIIEAALENKQEQRIWIHCSSLGEFEQGRPLIEAIKAQYPHYKIVLTFFSPSGYEVRKDYKYADYVFYLPMDRKATARRFVELLDPVLTIFVKYEFWHYYLDELKKQKVPAVLVSAAFRQSQSFFKWYGGIFRGMLRCFDIIFVQDSESQRLLAQLGLQANVIRSGDTRYDRVSRIAEIAKKYPLVDKFREKDKLFIAGSTWLADERLLKKALHNLSDDWKMIVAPHEIDKQHLDDIIDIFEGNAVLYSQLSEKPVGYKVLVIDNIGMLSGLYSYGDIAYVGGGFQKGGIHNVLEPAVFGLPVFFGPRYDKFIEAKALVAHQYAFPIHNIEEFNNLLHQLLQDDIHLNALQKSIRAYIATQVGATGRIMAVLSDKWLR